MGVFGRTLPKELIDGEDYEIVWSSVRDVEPAGARLDLYIGNYYSRTIVEENGNTYLEVLDVKTSEYIIDDHWETLSVTEFINLINDTMTKYHGLTPNEDAGCTGTP